MRTLFMITFLGVCCLIPVSTASQESYAQKRTQEIVASFNKQKYAVKEKHGVRVEKYKKVESEPVIKPNLTDYSGLYETPDQGYVIRIEVTGDGSVKATGSEPVYEGNRQARSFRLEGATVRGAMLSGTKVYSDGATAKFEGVFIKRTAFDSPTDPGVSAFGLGVILNPVEVGGVTLDKLFYQFKR
jgi:hypothetical protein